MKPVMVKNSAVHYNTIFFPLVLLVMWVTISFISVGLHLVPFGFLWLLVVAALNV
jgi:hypothetical protein